MATTLPFKNKFTVELPISFSNNEVLIQLIDVKGKMVWEKKCTTLNNLLNEEVSMDNYISGIYMLKIICTEGVQVQKIVKE